MRKIVIFLVVFSLFAFPVLAGPFSGGGYSLSPIISSTEFRFSQHIPLEVGYYSNLEKDTGFVFSFTGMIPTIESINIPTETDSFESYSIDYGINFGLNTRGAHWWRMAENRNGVFSSLGVGAFAETHLATYKELGTKVLHQRLYAGPSLVSDLFIPVGDNYLGFGIRDDITLLELNIINTGAGSASDFRTVFYDGIKFSVFFTSR